MDKNIVFIPWIKDESRATRSLPYKYSISSWKQWCKKNDCELVIMDEPICPVNEMKITWQRYYVLDILENSGIDYNQVLMVDADTIIHPDTPNFFEMTDGKFTAVHNEGCYDWICRSIENYHKHLFSDIEIPFGLNEYINTGFLIFNKSHKQFINKFLEFYNKNADKINQIQETFKVGTCQSVIQYLLKIENVDLNLLPYEYNMCDLPTKEILDEQLTMTKVGWIYHYNAIPNNHDASLTMYWMKKTYEHLYGKLSD